MFTDSEYELSNNFKSHNYIEPYNNALDKGQNNYTKGIKPERKHVAYDTCSGVENYSHINLGSPKLMPKAMDTYSHMQIGGCKDETYNHIHIKSENQ